MSASRGETLMARPGSWKWLLGWSLLCAGVTVAPTSARADALPLPPKLQEHVNRAIDRGVRFLEQTQTRLGTWSPTGQHAAGYAAFPGLTLLECGAPASHPAVQRAAAIVLQLAPKMDKT